MHGFFAGKKNAKNGDSGGGRRVWEEENRAKPKSILLAV